MMMTWSLASFIIMDARVVHKGFVIVDLRCICCMIHLCPVVEDVRFD